MKLKLIVLTALIFSGSVLFAQNWYKGNLHTHSYWSDGDDYPEMIADWYKSNGYHFLGFSEHNKLQEGTAWKSYKTPEDREAYNKYLTKFGGFVEYYDWGGGQNAARLKTLEEYRSLFEEEGKFIFLQNEEVTSSFYTQPIHMVASNTKYLIGSQFAKTKSGIIQKVVDKLHMQRVHTSQRMIVQLCHPNFHFAVTADDIIPVNNLRFFEVINGAPGSNTRGNRVNDATEVIWDKVNIHRVKNRLPLLYGVGVDDAHNYHSHKPELLNTGRAWIVVNAPKLDQTELMKAMEEGKYYVSTGVELDQLKFTEKSIDLQVKPEEGVRYKIQFIGVKKGKSKSEIFKEIEGISADYTIKSDELFVRARIISSKLRENVALDDDYQSAWTQPIVHYSQILN